jgi:hypothetical protein
MQRSCVRKISTRQNFRRELLRQKSSAVFGWRSSASVARMRGLVSLWRRIPNCGVCRKGRCSARAEPSCGRLVRPAPDHDNWPTVVPQNSNVTRSTRISVISVTYGVYDFALDFRVCSASERRLASLAALVGGVLRTEAIVRSLAGVILPSAIPPNLMASPHKDVDQHFGGDLPGKRGCLA